MPSVQDAVPNPVPRAGRKEWIGLGVLALPLLLVSMDVSVLYFAVPAISRDLGATATQQLWILDIYGFVLAGLLLTMGALGDRVGRRRLLMVGAAAFGAASLAAAYASSPLMLIGARGLLAVGGATLMPSTASLVRHMFRDSKQRATAIAIWTGVMTGGVSLGPVLSGVLLEHFWWGSVFLINLPVMVVLLLLTPILLPEHRNPRAGWFDLPGSVLSLAAVLAVIYGIKHGAVDGFGVAEVGFILVGLALGAAFVQHQRTAAHPMLDLSMFRIRGFGGSLTVNTVTMFALVGHAVFITQYLQLVLGMGPLRAALWSLLPSVGVAAAAPTAGILARRVNKATVMAGGLLLAATGFAVMTQISTHSSLVPPLVGAGLLAAGLVAVMTLVNDVILGTVSVEHAGTASALTETSSELGGALGIALLGSIGAAVYRHAIAPSLPVRLPSAAASTTHESLAGALTVAQRLPQAAGEQLGHAARQAFVDGFHTVAVTGTAVLVLAALLTASLLRGALAHPACDAVEAAPTLADVP
jgi:DHA2 family multidrug resistance protein-like MFS transporter